MRVVRMRPGLVFKKEAAEGIRRLFAGPFFPSMLANPALINIVPDIENLRSQVVHSYDVGEAFRLGIVNEDARGPFNLAAEPVLDAGEIGRILNARPVPMSAGLARAGAGLSWALRLQPVPPGWLDLSRNVPIMDTSKARTELGWTPQVQCRRGPARPPRRVADRLRLRHATALTEDERTFPNTRDTDRSRR